MRILLSRCVGDETVKVTSNVAHILPGSAIAEVDLLWHYKLCGIAISKGTRVLYLSATRANRISVHALR
jgi:hypothetical protein